MISSGVELIRPDHHNEAALSRPILFGHTGYSKHKYARTRTALPNSR
jgi:hypothetical protein